MLSEKILTFLANNPDVHISGQKMADAFGVSRNAVWKAITRLKDEGHHIEVASRKGYRLIPEGDILNATAVASFLLADDPYHLEYIAEIDSTNDYAKKLAEQHAPEWTVVLSNRQTKGKGRLGRAFHSPQDSGLYMSIVLRPTYAAQEASLLTIAAAAAVAEAVEAIQPEPVGIKWVNDCFIGTHKVAGILTEAAISMEDQTLRYAVVGIGINVYAPENGFPKELAATAGAIFPADAKRQNTRAKLAADVCGRFRSYASDLLARRYIDVYRAHLNMLNRTVQLITPNTIESVVPLDINDDGQLLVRDAQDITRTVYSGEISLRF